MAMASPHISWSQESGILTQSIPYWDQNWINLQNTFQYGTLIIDFTIYTQLFLVKLRSVEDGPILHPKSVVDGPILHSKSVVDGSILHCKAKVCVFSKI